MGICKCSKKRVTSTFCFEHKVNVCEFCMINSHPACIVQPYLQWLEDSSYKSKCSFCQLNLSNEECVRLLCFHVFHWTCLNKYCSSLPSNTAPAGYSCIDCNIPIFPSSNSPSPIYVALKKKLITTEWARIGLGLPKNPQMQLTNGSTNSKSVSNHSNTSKTAHLQTSSSESSKPLVENPVNTIQQTFEQKKNQNSSVFIHHNVHQSSGALSIANDQKQQQQLPPVHPVSMNNVNNYINNHTGAAFNSSTSNSPNVDYMHSNHNSFSSFNASSRKIMDSGYNNDRDRLILDIDDDKYRTRSSVDKILRFLKFMNYKHNFNAHQRLTIKIVLLVLVIFFVIYLLISLGRQSADDDPLLNPQFDPNIHLQDVDDFN